MILGENLLFSPVFPQIQNAPSQVGVAPVDEAVNLLFLERRGFP